MGSSSPTPGWADQVGSWSKDARCEAQVGGLLSWEGDCHPEANGPPDCCLHFISQMVLRCPPRIPECHGDVSWGGKEGPKEKLEGHSNPLTSIKADPLLSVRVHWKPSVPLLYHQSGRYRNHNDGQGEPLQTSEEGNDLFNTRLPCSQCPVGQVARPRAGKRDWRTGECSNR